VLNIAQEGTKESWSRVQYRRGRSGEGEERPCIKVRRSQEGKGNTGVGNSHDERMGETSKEKTVGAQGGIHLLRSEITRRNAGISYQ